MLMDAGDFDGSASAYKTTLERARLKAVPLLGLARAEQARGNDEAAAFALAQYEQTRAGVRLTQ